MAKFMSLAKKFARDEEGATMVEYGVMVALITAVSIVIIKSIGAKVLTAFTTVDTQLTAS